MMNFPVRPNARVLTTGWLFAIAAARTAVAGAQTQDGEDITDKDPKAATEWALCVANCG